MKRVMDVKEKIPSQEHGAKSNVSYAVKGAAENDGDMIYEKARKNLLDINRWHELSGALSARFYLTDPYGKETDRLPLQGDYIKIHLPSSADDKFEWVRIELIEERKPGAHIKWIMIRVRPSDPPHEKQETEHFFSEEATSSFCVEQDGRKVKASVRGRNELPNIDAPGLLSKVRNAIVGIAAMAGFNYPQWKALTRGILKE